jgi:hypothetical protein
MSSSTKSPGTDLVNRLDGTAIVIVDEFVNKDLLMQGTYRWEGDDITIPYYLLMQGTYRWEEDDIKIPHMILSNNYYTLILFDF